MATVDLTASSIVSRPAEAVWEVLADYRRDPEWRTGVLTMTASTSGPAVVGTRTDERMRVGGRSYRNEGEVTLVQPGRRLEWRTHRGADAHGARSVRPIDGDSCEVTLELHAQPHGIERLLAPVLRRMLARNLAADLRALDGCVGEIAMRA